MPSEGKVWTKLAFWSELNGRETSKVMSLMVEEYFLSYLDQLSKVHIEWILS